MREPLSPCFKCENRTVSCHGSCKLYLEFKTAHAQWAELVYKNRSQDASIAQIEANRFKPYYKHKLYKDKHRGGL